MAIEVQKVELKELIAKARQANVKRVLLTSYGSVEPVRESGAIVLAGMTTVAATMLDAQARKIYRWQTTGRSKGMVTIVAGVGRGPLGLGEPIAQLREDVHQLLREEGFEVDEGEWTPEAAERLLASRQRLIG